LSLLLALVVSCNKPGSESVVVKPQSLPFALSDTLLRIDSLMQHDAYSALQMLLSFRADSVISTEATPSTVISTEAKRSGEISCHYQSILLSEALYKTYNVQSNRTELQAAMHCFDSLAVRYPDNDDFIMLAARSHYMNGVGFYENDSIVEACQEYLHTLEIMEEHFDVDKLTGFRAKFMALTYNRLVDLFSDNYMMEPAIYCGGKALYFCTIEPTSKYGIANSLYQIGNIYDMSNNIDSAFYYYNLALEALPDDNNFVYRNIMSNLALLNYSSGLGAESSLYDLKQVLEQTDDIDEKTMRNLGIGYIFNKEGVCDSAVLYLNNVFENNTNLAKQIQAADFLRTIYQNNGDTNLASKYSEFLAEHTLLKYHNIKDASSLNDLFYNFLKEQNDKKHNHFTKEMNLPVFIISFVIIIAITIALRFGHRTKLKTKEDLFKYKMAETSQKHTLEKDKLLDDIAHYKKQIKSKANRETNIEKLSHLLKEPICNSIISACQNHNIKRSSKANDYPELILSEKQLQELSDILSKYFCHFDENLEKLGMKPQQILIDVCHMYLLGLNKQQIAILLNKDYSSIVRYEKTLKTVFKTDKIKSYIRHLAIND